MNKDDNYYQFLLQRWLSNQCSVDEAVELMNHLHTNDSGRMLLKKMQEEFGPALLQKHPMKAALSEKVRQELLTHIEGDSPAMVIRRRFGWLRMAAAAVMLLSLGSAAYLFLTSNGPEKQTAQAVKQTTTINDVVAGKSRAVLTLANGKQIILDSASVGKLAQEGSTSVVNKGDQLVYHQGNGQQAEVVYNSLATARGESYPLVLADGSKVWLNASSSIRFPTAFPGSERKVEVTGEVYFEIAQDKSRPFRVSVNDMTVEVLGTSFDINAYVDEATVNTTLVEGSVKVSSGTSALRLSAGQQSQWKSGAGLQLAKGVNVEEVVAWKEGFFHFESAELTGILRQFSRWYDVDVVFEGKVKPRRFFGIVSRSSSLSDVLKMLQANDIKFRIEGKKLVVQSG